jgi:hypothetical protein
MRPTLLFIVAAVAVLTIGTLAIMNDACKSSYHEWCAPKLAYNIK